VLHEDNISNVIEHELALFHHLEGGLCNSIVLLWHCVEQDHCLHDFRDDDCSGCEVLETFVHLHDVKGRISHGDLLGDCIFKVGKDS